MPAGMKLGKGKAPLGILMLCVLLSVFIASQAFSKKPEVPYKATTVDECIQEKECVWHHFLLAVQQTPAENKASQYVNVKKWMEPVRVRVAGSLGQYDKRYIEENYFNKIAPYFYQGLTFDQKYNFIILFTDDIERELGTRFNSFFENASGKNLALKVYNGDTCHYLHAQHSKNTKQIIAYFAFIHKDHPDVKGCLREAVYSGLGPSNLPSSPIWDDLKKQSKYSKLERLLLIILYSMPITDGMSYQAVKAAFDKHYPDIQKLAQERERLNDY